MGSIEPENVVQNLDSLWFFSNALLSTNPLKSPLPSEKQIINNNNQYSNDTIPILESPTSTKSPTSPSPPNTTSSLKKTNPNKADNTDIDNRAVRVKEGPEGERSSKLKRRAKKCYSLHRRMISCSNVEGRVGLGYDGVVEMNSSHDAEAMKRQLRTWAVAVAYTAVHNTNSLMMVACS